MRVWEFCWIKTRFLCDYDQNVCVCVFLRYENMVTVICLEIIRTIVFDTRSVEQFM